MTIRQILAALAIATLVSCSRAPEHRTFKAPEDAVRALDEAVAKGSVKDVLAIFGPEGKDLLDSSDPVTASQNRQVFSVAVSEGWRLVDEEGRGKVLVIGNEAWPFPVPLVRRADGWLFDTAAGREEVLARRIGRNELAVIRICRTYVAVQRRYAQDGHDGKPPGRYAMKFRSDPGAQNGLYWAAAAGHKRSPLGDLIADAALDGRADSTQSLGAPFHGYHFKILTSQGSAADGGEQDYVVNGEMSRGFALVAWPAEYDVTGIMTFVVNHDAIVREKDLGPFTNGAARAMTAYNPDKSWRPVP
jgi:hypothetical protein